VRPWPFSFSVRLVRLADDQCLPRPRCVRPNGKAMCNNRDVAALFKKRHANVLQAIDRLECSPKFNELNFQSVEYRDGKGEARRSINMTKDGFVFLVMGFTGKDAARFKEAYITRFNEMEEQLRGSSRRFRPQKDTHDHHLQAPQRHRQGRAS